ncbi:MAG: hypothetical protein AAFO07_14740, partial [Bacteroidota bacterium]
GEAMTYNHGLWREQDYEEGKAALEKIGKTEEERLAKCNNDLEKDLLGAVELIYGEGTKYDRDIAYSKHMKALNKKYPNNQEVAAFYALSLLGSVKVGRDDEIYEQGAVIAQGILKENPNHPGALHYLIHSYDDPNNAVKAITAANNYSKVAPDAAHALHMPSHIYVALGMWDEVIASNIDSYNASVNRMARKELKSGARSYHAYHWWMYGALQKGDIAAADEIMKGMQQYVPEDPTRRARSYMIEMKGTYLVETDNWDSPFNAIETDKEDLNVVTQAADHFIDGMIAFKQNDAVQLEAAIKEINKKRTNAALLVSDEGVPLCNAGGAARNLPNKQDIDHSEIFETELMALQAWMNKDDKKTEALLQKAVEQESTVTYSYGPPIIVKPTFELYGEWLLEKGRAEDALKQFDYALKRGPKRMRALKGKLEAAKFLKDENLMSETQALMDEIVNGTKAS